MHKLTNVMVTAPSLGELETRLRALRGDAGAAPDMSVVVPVNAQGDLMNVVTLLADLSRYAGTRRIEVILVVNNFAPDQPPAEIAELMSLGVRVLAIPNVRRPGEAVGFSARLPGVRAAASRHVLLFDADCRIPDPTALFDWYYEQLHGGAAAAYTHVAYYDYPNAPSLHLRFALHHLSRWVKRAVLGIPTTRGSNYAVDRDTMVDLYDRGLLADEMNVGPTFKRLAGRVVYSGKQQLAVLTSARMFRPGWRRIGRYFWYRLRYNIRVLPVRPGVARATGREKDPVRRYVNNRPVREPAAERTNFVQEVRRTLRLLGPGRRGRWLLLVGIMLTVAAIEAVGAVLVFTLMELITSGRSRLSLPLVGDIVRGMSDIELPDLQLAVAITIAIFFPLRAVIIIGRAYLQGRLVHNAGARLSHHLLRGYLSLPYIEHTRLNSSELIRNAFDSTQNLVTQVMKPAVEVITELVIITGLTIVLVVAAPQATLIAALVLGPLVWLLQRAVQPRLKRLGLRSQQARRQALQSMQQALGGVRDIKLLRREEEFVRGFAHDRHVMARTEYMKTALSEVPRALIETGLVLVIVAVLGAALIMQTGIRGVLPTLGVFAYVGIRLQPSLRKIVQGINHVRFGAAIIDDLLTDRRRVDAVLAARAQRLERRGAGLQRAIELRNVSFTYAGSSTPALQAIDLTIAKGEFVGICGPTGGGKSTLIDLITGLLQPTTGEVLIDGRPLGEEPIWWYAELGVVSQSIFLMDDTLRRNIAFGQADEEIDEVLLQRALERAQLQDVIANLPGGLDTVVGERGVRLSGGQRQRVAVARALYHEPSVIIFDEGTSALDAATEAALVVAVNELKAGRTLISVAHRISTVRHADRIVVVQGGRIVNQGRHDDLLNDSELFRALAL